MKTEEPPVTSAVGFPKGADLKAQSGYVFLSYA